MQRSKQERVGWAVCLPGTDIVLWQYINPQRTHESFCCPVPEEGQSSASRPELHSLPNSLRAPQQERHLPLWEIELGPSLIITSLWCLLTNLNNCSCWVWMSQLKKPIFPPSCSGVRVAFSPGCCFSFLFFCSYFLSISNKWPVHSRLRCSVCWLEPRSFTS